MDEAPPPEQMSKEETALLIRSFWEALLTPAWLRNDLIDLGKLVCDCLQGAKLVAAVQPTLLVSRTDTKDFRRFRSDVDWMNNAGYPGVTWGGWMLGASVGVEAKW